MESGAQQCVDLDGRGRAGVDGVDDLGVVDALEVDGGDAELAVAELALNDHERDAFAGHLDGVGVSQLMRGEASPHAGSRGSPTHVSARGGVSPVATARSPRDDAKQRSDWELEPCVKPWLQLLSAPRVHADFAASSAFAVANEQRSPSLVEVGFAERERFLNAQAGTPQDHDQASRPLPMRAVAGTSPSFALRHQSESARISLRGAGRASKRKPRNPSGPLRRSTRT